MSITLLICFPVLVVKVKRVSSGFATFEAANNDLIIVFLVTAAQANNILQIDREYKNIDNLTHWVRR